MSIEHLSVTFAALGDPVRLSILKQLAKGPVAVTELAKPFQISLPAITRHLKVLEKAGLISRGREAQWRPCRLEATGFQEVSAWVDGFKVHWESRFDRLESYLSELKKISEKKGTKNVK